MSTEVTRVVYKETNTEDFTGRKEPLNPASLRSTGVLRAACPASDRPENCVAVTVRNILKLRGKKPWADENSCVQDSVVSSIKRG